MHVNASNECFKRYLDVWGNTVPNWSIRQFCRCKNRLPHLSWIILSWHFHMGFEDVLLPSFAGNWTELLYQWKWGSNLYKKAVYNSIKELENDVLIWQFGGDIWECTSIGRSCVNSYIWSTEQDALFNTIAYFITQNYCDTDIIANEVRVDVIDTNRRNKQIIWWWELMRNQNISDDVDLFFYSVEGV